MAVLPIQWAALGALSTVGYHLPPAGDDWALWSLPLAAMAVILGIFASRRPHHTLHGRIIDAQSDLPIAGAAVHFKGSSVVAESDACGRYSLAAMGDTCRIVVAHPAYYPWVSQLLSTADSETHELRIELQKRRRSFPGIRLHEGIT